MTKRRPDRVRPAVRLKPWAIDPAGCGCTDCIIRESVPLDAATDQQIIDMIDGYLTCRLGKGVEIRVQSTYVTGSGWTEQEVQR